MLTFWPVNLVERTAISGLSSVESPGGTVGKVRIPVPKGPIAEFCRRNHIRRFSLFGSVLRDDFSPDSDVDILVEFRPGHVPGFFGLLDMEEELSFLFGGRKVDLRTAEDMSRYFRDEVLESAEVQYAQE